jgi:hypothetical protein
MERDDEFVREEEEAAAAEARAIGGSPGEDPFEGDPDRFDRDRDPAFRAVDEAGGGDAEGFEQAEALLEEHATEPRGPSPFVDVERVDEEEAAFETSDEYGEADHVESAELREDQLGPADDQPGTGTDEE